MAESSRRYIFGVTPHNTSEFLVSVLCDEDAVKYIKGHRKVFGKRYNHYTFGKMSEDKEYWRVVE